MSDHLSDLDLSIIIPAYKETNKIRRDIRAAEAFLNSQQLVGEILVVDDGSPDDTVAAAKSLEVEVPSLKVLSYTPNRGKGHALRYGITRSRGKIVMFADSGLCVPYEIATIGLAMLNLGMCDIAHGSRRMRGSVRKRQPLYRRIGSKVYAYVVYAVMGVPGYISDTQCGFKLYRGDVARYLYGQSFTDGFMFDTEVILRALMQGYQILEFPVLWSNDSDTRYDAIWGTLRNFKELIKIRRATWSSRFKASKMDKSRTDVPLPIARRSESIAVRSRKLSPSSTQQ
ncbi:MAG TPA: glycosyltransferase [Coleofasciculaceae cyanobacterium]